ncbi:MAG: STAS domain-containing protein [Treponema sp.]|nr:STAS domain-containing protein [Treponema sp.]
MQIKISKSVENIYFLKLNGSLDLNSSKKLKDNIMRIIETKATHIILDIDKVNHINSAGIGALISIYSTLRKINCPLILLSNDGPVIKALELTRLRGYFIVVESLEDAILLTASSELVATK